MMKKLLAIGLLALLYVPVFAQNDVNMGIIPAPVSVKKGAGTFKLDKTVVLISNEVKNSKSADLLNAFIVSKAGFSLREAKSAMANERAIVLSSAAAEQLPAEGYKISINPKTITITGKAAGLFYGVQSVMQLMPDKQHNEILIPAAEINDYPRFKYRGLHLDVGRHVFPVAFIKKYIDLMAQYKLNNFHWHLTEDQGWRIEIKKYPKLTATAASRNGTIIGHYPGVNNDGEVYKGFYTQNEVKEVVAYAMARFINVIPEIEMPGHASAAIAAYPELSCFPDKDTFVADVTPWAGSRKGKQVQQTWGVFDDVFVPSENTFKFLEDVLDEVIALFPSKYIHIGGDESPKKYWEQSEFCQKLIKQLGLKDEHELQSYFIQRIEKYVNSKSRSIIGWDEILEGGLAPNATVMSWRGVKGGIAAAQQKHEVIMTPNAGGLYFDHKQSESADEPTNIGGLAPYSKSYNYDPVPAELAPDEQKYVIGVQANVWTEYIQSAAKVEYFLLPRLFSLSEIAWSQASGKDFKNFSEERLPLHLSRLDKTGTNYWVPTPLGLNQKVLNGEDFSITLKEPIPGAKIYYTLDLTRPSEIGELYTKPIKVKVPKGQKQILKTIVVTAAGKRSVVTETILNNGSAEVAAK
ncbi:beta-N-acetylhexosaminidase [Pedobacter heparinus]|uniref:beta-N-acetylhexosaminidase n=1 Tax=Pedobacter heparinus (strain ATCC 13125 / DSM 2366 / CIP 104194 / JCM 7457 / NBRC 12017 / NCIMB 9290 / NRRL B-14731 / HIM 762-3) TaxID=485917 RepID=C6XUH7_PEDHD|nr:family 20 glycosylhydrolase [Pedobacter heparinus]ACU03827.1 Beta-N-acetylhexosaminidase [Pedobacter heparinus DSM 2366]